MVESNSTADQTFMRYIFTMKRDEKEYKPLQVQIRHSCENFDSDMATFLNVERYLKN